MKAPSIDSYTGYKGLPPLVDLMPVQTALDTGLTVEEAVARMKHFHYALKRLHEIFTSRITAEPIYELKMAYSMHSYLCIDHLGTFAARVREMRQPPYGLDEAPHPGLELLFDEIQNAPTSETLVYGLYQVIIPTLTESIAKQIEDTNLLFEHPTYRVLRHAHLEFKDIQTYGEKAVKALITDDTELKVWAETLHAALTAAGGMDSTGLWDDTLPAAMYSTEDYTYDPVPQRDERFQDLYNMGVNAEAFLHDPEQPALPKTLMMYYKRMREIDVPEMMASIITETPDKPHDYYRDMGRQLWDEARHAMMGELGFLYAGVDWTQISLNFTWSRSLNTMLDPLQRHAVLFYIEQGLMPKKTGKEAEWEYAVAAETPIAMKMQDYDWADEILHARIGRDWLVKALGSQKEAMEYGDKCWAVTYQDFNTWKDQGLTEHANWWPAAYRQACAAWDCEVDSQVEGFDTSYLTSRADMKEVSADA